MEQVTHHEFVTLLRRVEKIENELGGLLVSSGKSDAIQQHITEQLERIELLLEKNQKSLAERVEKLEINLAIRKDRIALLKYSLYILSTITAILAALHLKLMFFG